MFVDGCGWFSRRSIGAGCGAWRSFLVVPWQLVFSACSGVRNLHRRFFQRCFFLGGSDGGIGHDSLMPK